MENSWKKCSVCKKAIPLASKYYVCSVSGCKSQRKGIVFCSVQCWDAHRAVLNHRSAWAEEETAPRVAPSATESQPTMESTTRVPKRTIVNESERSSGGIASQAGSSHTIASTIETDTLVVVSKVKKLIRDASDFNTSQCAIDELTKKVAQECLKAIAQAKLAGRKTVMGRDIL